MLTYDNYKIYLEVEQKVKSLDLEALKNQK